MILQSLKPRPRVRTNSGSSAGPGLGEGCWLGRALLALRCAETREGVMLVVNHPLRETSELADPEARPLPRLPLSGPKGEPAELWAGEAERKSLTLRGVISARGGAALTTDAVWVR